MNDFINSNNTYTIDNIPLNKWFNVMIRVKNQRIDIYINGSIKRSIDLEEIPKQNYGNVYIAQEHFNGKISNLWYYNYALNISEINKLLKTGPNRKLISQNASSDNTTNYLSSDWYY